MCVGYQKPGDIGKERSKPVIKIFVDLKEPINQ